MSFKLELASPKDAPAIAKLRADVAKKLTKDFGQGPWSSSGTETGVLFAKRHSRVYAARDGNGLIATLTLATKKPWAIDRKYFTPCQRPIYLTTMAVSQELQRQGIGRRCVEAAIQAVKDWPGDAIFLDAYDAAAGAGEFYRKCGFREVGRASYRGVPLIYFEMLV